MSIITIFYLKVFFLIFHFDHLFIYLNVNLTLFGLKNLTCDWFCKYRRPYCVSHFEFEEFRSNCERS